MTPTKASEFRKEMTDGVEFDLPSGKTVRVRGIGIDVFIKVGYVPDFITPVIAKVVSEGGASWPEIDDFQKAKDWFRFLDSVCMAVLVSPRMVDDPTTDDEIAPHDMHYDDKMAILTCLGRPAHTIAGFRKEPKGHVQPVAIKPGNTPSAK